MNHSTLVTAEELAAHVTNRDWRIVDCRHDLFDHALGRREYAAGHIAGAFFADIEHGLSGPKTGKNGRHPLPSREQVAELFRAWGMSNGSQLVAYDAQGGQFAVRLWWLARWLGHSRVALLDGGWQAWLAAGGLTDREIPTRTRGSFEAETPLVAYVDAAYVSDHLGDPHTLVVDARAPERYAGEQEPIDPVAGHIPGAVNRFWQANLVDGKFKSPAALRAEFEPLLAGRRPEDLIHQCGSGVTSCHNVLAMEIAGLPGARLYAGSWSEWVADPTRPVARGRKP
ncbi:MAG TPA: sulfurtransferase [Burkholderiaceae bacterium]|nr:sulfurtransferase [Burkholderiaceae bacterium]